MRLAVQQIREDRAAKGLCPHCGKEMVYNKAVHKDIEYTVYCVACKLYYRDKYENKSYGRLLTENERSFRMNLVNATEVAKMLGISKSAMAQRQKRQKESGKSPNPLPVPIHFLNESAPLWNREDIEKYISKSSV